MSRQSEPIPPRRLDSHFESDVGFAPVISQTEFVVGGQAPQELLASLFAPSAADFQVDFFGFEKAGGLGSLTAGERLARSASPRADVHCNHFGAGQRRRF